MSNPYNEKLHELLIETKSILYVAATGAGPALQKDLWDNPGASQYLAGFYTPYGRTALHSFLGHPPEDSYCCEAVAYDLAMASYIRAAEHKVISKIDGDPVGMGITAAVASIELPRGDQRAHVCIITKDAVLYHNIVFKDKGTGKETRQGQDELLATLVSTWLGCLLEGPTKSKLNPGTKASETALERFYRYPIFKTNGTRHPRSSGGEGAVYLPATLNPIHDGHRAMCDAAEAELSPSGPGRIKASYLVSSCSPHKGSLTVQEMLFKAGMLRAERWLGPSRSVEFTHDEPLFIDKARKRPGSVFLIGADTMQRMLEPQWYGSEETLDDVLRDMSNLKTKFMVMERMVDGKVLGCRDIEVKWPYGNIFEPFGGRVDISSSELREDAAQ